MVGLIAAGAGNREIAERLVISQFTVKRHVQNILRKLGLHTRAEAASRWRWPRRPSRRPASAATSTRPEHIRRAPRGGGLRARDAGTSVAVPPGVAGLLVAAVVPRATGDGPALVPGATHRKRKAA